MFPGSAHQNDEEPAAVAESRAPYAAGASGEPASNSRLSLAGERGLTPEALARAVHLSPALVRWLNAGGIALQPPPQPLVERLAAGLGVARGRVVDALQAAANAAAAIDAPTRTTFREAAIADASLSTTHLREWLAVLDADI